MNLTKLNRRDKLEQNNGIIILNTIKIETKSGKLKKKDLMILNKSKLFSLLLYALNKNKLKTDFF